MNKKWLLPAALTVGGFVAVVGYGDFAGTIDEIGNLPVSYLFAALGLASANYLLRFLRWTLYLRVLQIAAPARVSALVFLSGLAMSITPGKAGELVKCHLLNSRTGAPVGRSAPVVVMERLTDVISVIILGLTGFACRPRWSLSWRWRWWSRWPGSCSPCRIRRRGWPVCRSCPGGAA